VKKKSDVLCACSIGLCGVCAYLRGRFGRFFCFWRRRVSSLFSYFRSHIFPVFSKSFCRFITAVVHSPEAEV
jgi:hypothetical protein